MNEEFERWLYDFVHYGDCSDVTGEFTKEDMSKAFQAGQQSEREACAELVENLIQEYSPKRAADKIRKRGNHEC